MGSLTLRHYGLKAGDWQTVSGWHEARHGEMLPETILPPLGIIVEDEHGPAAAVFAFQSVGIGVAHADHFLTRPGLNGVKGFRCGARLLEALRKVLSLEGYGLIKVFAPCERLGHILQKLGFRGHRGTYLITT